MQATTERKPNAEEASHRRPIQSASAGDPGRLAYPGLKRLLDLALGLCLAIILAPVIALMALLIVATSPGPAFYTQVRLGRFGQPFLIWKLRTMTHRCEDESGPRWSTSGDSRVTWLGRILRRLHIDEFPQLWNVLRGDMSLVGPRPERPEFFPFLSGAIVGYADRLAVKPGVTGLAQVYLPPDEDLESVKQKQAFDLHYIRNLGPLLDIQIFVATALQAIGVPHFLVRPMLLLPEVDQVEGARHDRDRNRVDSGFHGEAVSTTPVS